ncbi:hypothetical protein CPB83DRAFT_847077 [Crepidotus variabilis]|uniref:Uncharacterized protein n=1 Tax=Crepidotus variabilis TaxID=179855 RepID=A0A9P6EPN2_9AGAR|nr:hypothetical protein CPB83DRAFT_847077 [Crepidotus variabilis]
MSISKVIKIAAFLPPEVITELNHLDPFISSNRYILKIDLEMDDISDRHVLEPIKNIETELAALQAEQSAHQIRATSITSEMDQGSGNNRVLRKIPRSRKARKELLIRRLCEIVAADRELPREARIDAIEIGPEPYRPYYQAIDGLSPKHVKLTAGFEGAVMFDDIESFFYPWDDIESAVISGEAEGWWLESFRTPKGETQNPDSTCAYPEFITRIKSLTLHYCEGFNFSARYLPVQMVNFKIVGIDALSTFCRAFERIPGLSERLQRLHLTSNRGCFEWVYFRQCLRECSSISYLFLALGDDEKYYNARPSPVRDNDTKLLSSFPPFVETLSFHCSTSHEMLVDLDSWIDATSQSGWLPQLKEITIQSNGPQLDRLPGEEIPKVSPERRNLFQRKIDRIYINLQSRSPPVVILP